MKLYAYRFVELDGEYDYGVYHYHEIGKFTVVAATLDKAIVEAHKRGYTSFATDGAQPVSARSLEPRAQAERHMPLYAQDPGYRHHVATEDIPF